MTEIPAARLYPRGQAQFSSRAMDSGISRDHHLQKRRLGPPGPRRHMRWVTMAIGEGMAIVDRAVLVTALNRGIGQALVEPALRRSAKRMTLTLNRKVDISR